MKKIFEIEVDVPYDEFGSKEISGMLNVAKNTEQLKEYLKNVEVLKVTELTEIPLCEALKQI